MPSLFRLIPAALLLGATMAHLPCQGQDAGPPPDAAVPALATDGQSLLPIDNEMVTPRLPDTPLDVIINTLELWTGRTALRPATLPSGNYSFMADRPITKGEAIHALETLLAMNQIGIAPLGDKFFKVAPLGNIRIEGAEMIRGSTLNHPPSGRIATKIFFLDFLQANEFVGQLASLLNPQLGGPVIFDKSNAFMVTDAVSTLQRIEVLLRELDRPVTADLDPKFYPLRFAKASDVVTKIRTMLQGPVALQLGAAFTYSADDRTNQVMLIADPRQHPFFDNLIAKLDVKADPNTRNEVLFLKHAKAQDVSQLLANLISGQSSASRRPDKPATPQNVAPVPALPTVVASDPSILQNLSPTQEFSALVTVIPDERSNSVVVSGTVDDLRLIKDLVDRLDILLAQVRIEVVIAEVTLSDNASSGIDSLGLVVEGNKLVGFKGAGPGLSVGGGTDTGGYATIEELTPGNYSLSGIVGISTNPRKSNSDILSQPTISTTHNQKGRIFVGQQQPVISSYLNDGTTTGTGGTGTTTIGGGYRTSVDREEIGILLEVKPLIGSDGSVQLEIKQEVEDIIGNVKIDGNDQPVVGKRETESFISARNGEIIVLGGLQRAKSSKTSSRLGPIPLIGDLLGSRSRTKEKTELIFFLRPIVLTNTPADNEDAIRRLEQNFQAGESTKKNLLNPPPSEPTP